MLCFSLTIKDRERYEKGLVQSNYKYSVEYGHFLDKKSSNIETWYLVNMNVTQSLS